MTEASFRILFECNGSITKYGCLILFGDQFKFWIEDIRNASTSSPMMLVYDMSDGRELRFQLEVIGETLVIENRMHMMETTVQLPITRKQKQSFAIVLDTLDAKKLALRS